MTNNKVYEEPRLIINRGLSRNAGVKLGGRERNVVNGNVPLGMASKMARKKTESDNPRLVQKTGLYLKGPTGKDIGKRTLQDRSNTINKIGITGKNVKKFDYKEVKVKKEKHI